MAILKGVGVVVESCAKDPFVEIKRQRIRERYKVIFFILNRILMFCYSRAAVIPIQLLQEVYC